jgi:site-specific DNA recombinase
LQEALEYYLSKESIALTFADKKHLIRNVVREIIIFDDKIEIFTF